MVKNTARQGLEFRMATENNPGTRLLLDFVSSNLLNNVYYLYCGNDCLGRMVLDPHSEDPIVLEAYLPNVFSLKDFSNAVVILRKLCKKNSNYERVFADIPEPFEILPEGEGYCLIPAFPADDGEPKLCLYYNGQAAMHASLPALIDSLSEPVARVLLVAEHFRLAKCRIQVIDLVENQHQLIKDHLEQLKTKQGEADDDQNAG